MCNLDVLQYAMCHCSFQVGTLLLLAGWGEYVSRYMRVCVRVCVCVCVCVEDVYMWS